MSSTPNRSKNHATLPQAFKKPPQPVVDPIDEAAMESFPASDPPAFTGTAASPSEKCTPRDAVKPSHKLPDKSKAD